MIITHPTYGPGSIIELKPTDLGDRIIVGFDDGVTRTLLLKFARFTIDK